MSIHYLQVLVFPFALASLIRIPLVNYRLLNTNSKCIENHIYNEDESDFGNIENGVAFFLLLVYNYVNESRCLDNKRNKWKWWCLKLLPLLLYSNIYTTKLDLHI